MIGRNEGSRLERALDSVIGCGAPVVYVDSGSTDDSCNAARKRGALVVDLEMTRPFTAARARNAGFERLIYEYPGTEMVAFIDGDCELLSGFLETAVAELDADPELVAVCGWRRERHPEQTIYNRICDVEWRWGEVGSIMCFGGDVLVRAAAVQAVDGYDPQMIAGEDFDLSIRLGNRGGRLARVDCDSTLHDADMRSAKQWWQRAKRCGHAYAQLVARHGGPPERRFVRELRKTMLWGALAPCAAVALTLPTLGASWLLFGLYPIRVVKVAISTRKRGFPWAHSVSWGASCVLSSFPGVVGVATCYLDRLRGRCSTLIEYK